MSTSAATSNIIAIYLIITMVNGQSCVWTVAGNTLDLSCLEGKVLTTTQEDGSQDYSFSVCANSQSCEDRSVMAAQFPKNLPGRCFNVGSFDPSIRPTYQDISGGQWQFKYVGDTQDCPAPGREWEPIFICDTTTEYTIGVVTETSTCDYAVPIRTKYACVGYDFECPEDEDDAVSARLSTGWIVIIVFVSVFMLYCIVGYIYMAKRVNTEKGFSDFSGNIPNKSGWIKFCFLVMAGCAVTRDCVVGLLNKDREHDGSGHEEGSDSRDESSASGYQLELE